MNLIRKLQRHNRL